MAILGVQVTTRTLEELIDTVLADRFRACGYWIDEEDKPKVALQQVRRLKRHKVIAGIARLIGRGGESAAVLVEDWIGDDTTTDAIVQLALFEELRYG